MKEREKKLAGLPYNFTLLQKQEQVLREGDSKCPSAVKEHLTKCIKKLSSKCKNAKGRMKKVYEDDYKCYQDIKAAAIDGRKSQALKFWKSMDVESQDVLHNVAKGNQEVLDYFNVKQESVTEEDTTHKFPKHCKVMYKEKEYYVVVPDSKGDLVGISSEKDNEEEILMVKASKLSHCNEEIKEESEMEQFNKCLISMMSDQPVDEFSDEIVDDIKKRIDELPDGDFDDITEADSSVPREKVEQCALFLVGKKGNYDEAAELFGADCALAAVRMLNNLKNRKFKDKQAAQELQRLKDKASQVNEEDTSDKTNALTDEPKGWAQDQFNSSGYTLLSKVDKEGKPTGMADVPAEVLTDLKAHSKDLESRIEMFKDPGYRLDRAELEKLVSRHESLMQLHALLKDGSVENVQKAMIYLTSLQSPIMNHMPLSVRQYLMKGYNGSSLLDLFRGRD